MATNAARLVTVTKLYRDALRTAEIVAFQRGQDKQQLQSMVRSAVGSGRALSAAGLPYGRSPMPQLRDGRAVLGARHHSRRFASAAAQAFRSAAHTVRACTRRSLRA